MNDENTKSDKFNEWALVELMGHSRIAGRVSEQTIGGACLLRVDVPECGTDKAFTRFFGPASIYSISPMGEAEAKALCVRLRPEPVARYEVPQLQEAMEDARDPHERDHLDAIDDHRRRRVLGITPLHRNPAQIPIMLLFFDTETTGKADFKASPMAEHQPRLVELAALLTDEEGREFAAMNLVVKPDGWTIPTEASDIHGIDHKLALKIGIEHENVLHAFLGLLRAADTLVAWNLAFDDLILNVACNRELVLWSDCIAGKQRVDPMLIAKDTLKLPSKWKGGDWKWPKLTEAYQFFFGQDFDAHHAMDDVRAMARIWFEHLRQK